MHDFMNTDCLCSQRKSKKSKNDSKDNCDLREEKIDKEIDDYYIG